MLSELLTALVEPSPRMHRWAAVLLALANAGWVCDAHDVTTPASNVVEQSAGNTISVTLTNYVRTTGVAGNFTAADKIAVKCLAY